MLGHGGLRLDDGTVRNLVDVDIIRATYAYHLSRLSGEEFEVDRRSVLDDNQALYDRLEHWTTERGGIRAPLIRDLNAFLLAEARRLARPAAGASPWGSTASGIITETSNGDPTSDYIDECRDVYGVPVPDKVLQTAIGWEFHGAPWPTFTEVKYSTIMGGNQVLLDTYGELWSYVPPTPPRGTAWPFHASSKEVRRRLSSTATIRRSV